MDVGVWIAADGTLLKLNSKKTSIVPVFSIVDLLPWLWLLLSLYCFPANRLVANIVASVHRALPLTAHCPSSHHPQSSTGAKRGPRTF
jgi:hypothetical protein